MRPDLGAEAIGADPVRRRDDEELSSHLHQVRRACCGCQTQRQLRGGRGTGQTQPGGDRSKVEGLERGAKRPLEMASGSSRPVRSRGPTGASNAGHDSDVQGKSKQGQIGPGTGYLRQDSERHVATFNAGGIQGLTRRQESERWQKGKKVWAMVLQERKANAVATERRWATFYLSSGVDPERRQEITEKIRRARRRRKKCKRFGARGSRNIGSDVRAVNGRMMWAVMQSKKPWALVTVYAPHVYASPSEKDRFYEDLTRMLREIPRRFTLLIGGDFNVRLGGRRRGEERWIGPHTGPDRPEGDPGDPVEDNRTRFVQLLREFDPVVASTWKQISPRRQVSFRVPGATWGDVGRRWALDHWLILYRWPNAVVDVYSDTAAWLPYEHAQLVPTLRSRFARREQA